MIPLRKLWKKALPLLAVLTVVTLLFQLCQAHPAFNQPIQPASHSSQSSSTSEDLAYTPASPPVPDTLFCSVEKIGTSAIKALLHDSTFRFCGDTPSFTILASSYTMRDRLMLHALPFSRPPPV